MAARTASTALGSTTDPVSPSRTASWSSTAPGDGGNAARGRFEEHDAETFGFEPAPSVATHIVNTSADV